MKRIFATPRYKREYKSFVRRFPFLRNRIQETLKLLESDVHSPSLKTHKLEGKLLGFESCSCGYDCRIVFSIEPADGEEIIVLYSIGTHDQVY